MPRPQHQLLQADLCLRTAPIIFVTTIAHGQRQHNLMSGIEILLLHVKALPADSNISPCVKMFSAFVRFVLLIFFVWLAIFGQNAAKAGEVNSRNTLLWRKEIEKM